MLRSTFWGSCEGLSFEEYVRSSANIPSCKAVINMAKQSEEEQSGKDACLERMFQNGRQSSSAFIYANHAQLVAKKNRLITYKFGHGRDLQLQERRRNKTPDDLVIRSRGLIAHSVKKQLQLEVPGTASTVGAGQWRKIYQLCEAKNSNSELMINAEAVIWEQKKTASLSDASYCRVEKQRPSMIRQIQRLRKKQERQERQKDAEQQKKEKRRTVSPVKYNTQSPNASPKTPNRQGQAQSPKRAIIRVRLTDAVKLQSQAKMPIFPEINEPEELEQETIYFLKDPLEMDLGQPLFSQFEAKESIVGQAFSLVRVQHGNPQLLFEHQADCRLQIASLTKTMTCLLVLLLIERLKIDIPNTYVKVNEKASRLMGTTAGLLYADYVRLSDILYGLMLPSGNDAALALAEWGGNTIRNYCSRKTYGSITSCSKQRPFLRLSLSRRSALSLFVLHMNNLAKTLGLENTKFANVHGLMNKRNYSCSRDQVRLCLFAMKRADFRRIVNCQEHKCTIPNKMFANEREIIWRNTNRLLQTQGFCGVKTGMTPAAGPCLASCYKVSDSQHIYIVLLKTKSLSHRFEQSKTLLIEAIRLLYVQTGSRDYAAALTKLKVQVSPETMVDLEDRNEVEDEETPD